MNANLSRNNTLMCALLLSAGVTLGCTTVVVPVSPEDVAIADEDHGLLFGQIHLTRNGKDRTAGLKWPHDMKWWVREETHGKRFLIAHLPIDGPFVVKLPAGSYRLTDVSFDSIRGIWHTLLPTTFAIRPRECTALGTWDLQMQTGFFAGWITRQVFYEQEFVQDEFRRILATRGCPILAAPLESPMKSRIRLSLQTRGTDFILPRD